MIQNDSLIPVRMLVQFAYCKRLGYMEWVQGEFAENLEVAQGTLGHKRVDTPVGKPRKPEEDQIHTRSVMLSDEELGLVGKLDVLEIENDEAVPVEYKRGKVPDIPGNAYDSHMVQVCAQGLLLSANGYASTHGIIYYVGSKQRITVHFTDELISHTKEMIKEMGDVASSGILPPPLVDSPKCPRCSLVGICMPDEINNLSENPTVPKDQIRRMYPLRDDAVPLYVQSQGARISKSGQKLHVKVPDSSDVQKIRLLDISQIVLIGNVQITTQTIKELCRQNIPISYMSFGGWFLGMTMGLAHKNVELRIKQYAMAGSFKPSMMIARAIVQGKIRNCITMLRRNHPGDISLGEMEDLVADAGVAKAYERLLGIEGMAARIYFSHFGGMLKRDFPEFDFDGRNRRPPKDPINAVLSYLYALLARQSTVVLSQVGLDPYLGYLHRPKYGKPALALDIMEEFRPIVADSVCITMVNQREITPSDFVITKFGTTITDKARKTLLSAYERRMETSVTHPLLGYKLSYRRVLETQARLLSRHLLGEIPSYPSFRTR